MQVSVSINVNIPAILATSYSVKIKTAIFKVWSIDSWEHFPTQHYRQHLDLLYEELLCTTYLLLSAAFKSRF